MPKPNMHPCYCPWCAKNTDQLIDVGTEDRVYKCGECQNHFTGPVWPGKCPVCSALPKKHVFVQRLSGDDRVPGSPCPNCITKQERLDQEVRDGGVGFQCVGCGSDGVFSAVSSFSKKAREEANKPAPEDMYIQIVSCQHCEVHNPVAKLKENADIDQLWDQAKADAADPNAATVDLLDDNTEFAKAWDAAVDGTGTSDRRWILPHDDKLYPIQQAFREVAVRSGEESPSALFELARTDYLQTFEIDPPKDVAALFQQWSVICAKLNTEFREDNSGTTSDEVCP